MLAFIVQYFEVFYTILPSILYRYLGNRLIRFGLEDRNFTRVEKTYFSYNLQVGILISMYFSPVVNSF